MSSEAPKPNPPMLRDGAEVLMRCQMIKIVESLDFDHLKSCLTCVNFSEFQKQITPNYVQPPEWCNRFNGRPPARIIAYGCQYYSHNDEIPF